ncbi:VOC family protein [Variovorax sp. GB1P17]|uniref:VOC family protein n=1 Tax=Variovorax sp. GB1P17 TaxID=3443740 RepID=UPI003F47C2C6
MSDKRVGPQVRRTHLSLFVNDPFASAAWYERVLGMTETARGAQWVFLTFGKKHHDIALIRVPPGQKVGGFALQHYGLEVAGDLDEFRRLYGQLLRAGIEVLKTTDHKIGYGIYFTDPDGHRFEFFHELITDDEEGKQVLHLHNAPSDPIDLQPLYD